MEPSKKYIKISEISQLTGIPKSTIRYYIKEGIVPPPLKTGQTMAYYDQSHIERLELIRKIQDEEKLPLRFLKDVIRQLEEKERSITDDSSESPGRRTEIINAAISLFREKGYPDTSITDIVERAHIGRGTFYLYFRNKEEIFVECADKIFYAMYENVWNEIKDEKDMLVRTAKRALAFFRSYPQWQDMMNMLRAAAISDNEAFRKKLNNVMHQIIDPIIRDLEKGKEMGKFKDFDATVVGFALMGMAEYCGYMLHNGLYYDFEKLVKTLTELIFRGILNEKDIKSSDEDLFKGTISELLPRD